MSVGLPILWLPVSCCIVYKPPMASARIAAALSVERGASMKAQMSCKLIMQGYLVKVCTQKWRKAVRADRRFHTFLFAKIENSWLTRLKHKYDIGLFKPLILTDFLCNYRKQNYFKSTVIVNF